MHAIALALILLALTCLSTLVRRAIRLPIPLLQIAIGAAAAIPAHGLHVEFDPHAFLLLFIPPLLFSDGWRMPRRELRALRWPLFGNAVILVLITTLAGGYFLHWLIPHLPLSVAFAIAAVVSPTDATAFAAITSRIAVPSRLAHLLESEALLNDASGLVALRFAVAATLTGSFSPVRATATFLLVALGGLAIGTLLTLLYGRIARLLAPQEDDAPVQALLSALLPFAAYYAAERAGVSGILAAVAAGITANRIGLAEHSTLTARLQAGGMWRMIVFSFNGIIFVLLGTQLPGIAGHGTDGIDLVTAAAPLEILGQVAALTAVLILVRLIWVIFSLLVEHLTHRRDHAPDWRLILAATLGGVRGAITLAGVLTIPLTLNNGAAFPARDLAITLATGVILLSLLLASASLPLLLARAAPQPDPNAEEAAAARLAAMEAAITALESLPDSTQSRADLLASYQARRAAHQSPPSTETDATLQTLHRTALAAERAAIQSLRQANRINDETARDIITELDLIEAAILKRPLRLR